MVRKYKVKFTNKKRHTSKKAAGLNGITGTQATSAQVEPKFKMPPEIFTCFGCFDRCCCIGCCMCRNNWMFKS